MQWVNTTIQAFRDMTRRQQIIISIYLILGLPTLPLALLMLLIFRFIYNDREMFLPNNRQDLIVLVGCLMITFSFCIGVVVSIIVILS